MHYVLDENNNKVEAYDKEGVLAVLEQAIANGSLASLVADAAFVTKLKCCVSGQTNRIAFVSQAKYNELKKAGTVENGVYYYITDDTTLEDINALLEELTETVNDLTETVNDLTANKASKSEALCFGELKSLSLETETGILDKESLPYGTYQVWYDIGVSGLFNLGIMRHEASHTVGGVHSASCFVGPYIYTLVINYDGLFVSRYRVDEGTYEKDNRGTLYYRRIGTIEELL